MMDTLALAVTDSANEKIGACSVTYAAQASCPADCVFKDGGGCYAENGRLASAVTIPLNQLAAEEAATALDVAQAEAAAIDAMRIVPGRPLRLHTVGDCPNEASARLVAGAAMRYMARGGGPVWTYTHAWRVVPRRAWGSVSVLASCETPLDVVLARARGYAPSLVVEEFEQRARYDGILPCPAQTTEGVTCASCRLCMNDRALLGRDYAIGFAVHGTAFTIRQAVKALRDPDDPDRRLTSRDHALAFRAREGRWPTKKELVKLANVNPASASQMLAKLR